MQQDTQTPAYTVSLPAELWLYIHRLFTSDTSPLVAAYNERYQYVRPVDHFDDMRHFLRDVRTLVLVCRSWNDLGNEILYENVKVDGRFESLYAALQKPGNARLVRSIRLSNTRHSDNVAIIKLCPQVEFLVQPDVESHLDVGATDVQLPPLPYLRRIYWWNSSCVSALFLTVLHAAPNLQFLSLNSSSASDAVGTDPLPALASLQWLSLSGLSMAPTLQPLSTSTIPIPILRTDIYHITRLTCRPSHFIYPDFPTLPALQTLELFGSNSNTHFPIIFARCPNLRELCYDVWNTLTTPHDKLSSLSCIRLHSAVHVVRDWTRLQAHFHFFLDSSVPDLSRVILYGKWHSVITHANFVPLREGLRARGCRLEFPEGRIL
ncbi:hypothetical protein C8J57DRAFT_1356815 [Mycena rebaudengoi]|nr:hypothetical protein C8J57DRAFT_1356815 [Mycena rebaudengoi]